MGVAYITLWWGGELGQTESKSFDQLQYIPWSSSFIFQWREKKVSSFAIISRLSRGLHFTL